MNGNVPVERKTLKISEGQEKCCSNLFEQKRKIHSQRYWLRWERG